MPPKTLTSTREQRYKRHVRADTPPELDLEHPGAHYRDLLQACWDLRHPTTAQLAAHLGTSTRGIYEPLSRLYHAGHIERRMVFDAPVGIGSPPTIHLLTRAGGAALFGNDYTDAEHGNRIDQRGRRLAPTLRHHLAITDFQLLLGLGEPALVRFDADKEMATPIRVITPNHKGSTSRLTRWPDALASVASAAGLYHFLVEFDLDAAHGRKRERLVDRYLAYDAAIHDGIYASARGRERVPLWQALRLTPGTTPTDRPVAPTINVLFVTPTRKRRDDLHAIARSLHAAKGPQRIRQSLFWFAAADDYLAPTAGPSGRPTIDYEASARRLLDTPVLIGLNGRPAYLIPREKDDLD